MYIRSSADYEYTVDDNFAYHSFDDEPAAKHHTSLLWFKHGKLHRIDGPAVRFINGRQDDKWFINGNDVTEQLYEWAKDMNIDLDNLTEEDKILIQIKWEVGG